MGQSVKELKLPQKLFLQRFLAHHVMSENDAQSLWNEILDSIENKKDLGRDLNHTLTVINGSLRTGFGFEVRTATLSIDFGESFDKSKQSPSTSPRKKSAFTRYHAIVNRDDDSIAKVNGNPSMVKGRGVHEMALFRLILERLIETNMSTPEENESTTILRGAGCKASLPRMELLNLRTQLTGPHANKMDISQTEKAVSLFESEGWLAPAVGLPNDDNEDSRKSKKRKRRDKDRFNEANYLQIGPRTYLELPEMLTNLGLDKELLPQFILH